MALKQGVSFFQVSCGGCESWGWCCVSHILVCTADFSPCQYVIETTGVASISDSQPGASSTQPHAECELLVFPLSHELFWVSG